MENWSRLQHYDARQAPSNRALIPVDEGHKSFTPQPRQVELCHVQLGNFSYSHRICEFDSVSSLDLASQRANFDYRHVLYPGSKFPLTFQTAQNMEKDFEGGKMESKNSPKEENVLKVSGKKKCQSCCPDKNSLMINFFSQGFILPKILLSPLDYPDFEAWPFDGEERFQTLKLLKGPSGRQGTTAGTSEVTNSNNERKSSNQGDFGEKEFNRQWPRQPECQDSQSMCAIGRPKNGNFDVKKMTKKFAKISKLRSTKRLSGKDKMRNVSKRRFKGSKKGLGKSARDRVGRVPFSVLFPRAWFTFKTSLKYGPRSRGGRKGDGKGWKAKASGNPIEIAYFLSPPRAKKTKLGLQIIDPRNSVSEIGRDFPKVTSEYRIEEMELDLNGISSQRAAFHSLSADVPGQIVSTDQPVNTTSLPEFELMLEGTLQVTKVIEKNEIYTLSACKNRANDKEFLVKVNFSEEFGRTETEMWARFPASISQKGLYVPKMVWKEAGLSAFAFKPCLGSLSHLFFSNKSAVDPTYLWRVLTDAARGLTTLHDQKVAHMNINPLNLLLTDKGRVRLWDLSQSRDTSIEITTQNSSFRPSQAFGCHYFVPELQLKSAKGSDSGQLDLAKVDVFCLGLTMLELCLPFRELYKPSEAFTSFTEAGLRLSLDTIDVHSDFTTLITRMLSFLPKNRPTASEVLQAAREPHPVPRGFGSQGNVN